MKEEQNENQGTEQMKLENENNLPQQSSHVVRVLVRVLKVPVDKLRHFTIEKNNKTNSCRYHKHS